MGIVAAFGAGLVAGLALVVPLGAIGVLLVQEGAVRGWTGGVPAAGAVAGADLLCCLAALATGTILAPVITTWGSWPRIAGGAVLVAIAVWGLLRARRSSFDAEVVAPGVDRAPSWQRGALFFGLTVINPATLVYFAAIAAGIPTVTSSIANAALFAVGVAIASLAWQLLLVAAGAVLRYRTGGRFRRITSLIGNGAVALLGLLMLGSSLV